jgi:hypothetical protein
MELGTRNIMNFDKCRICGTEGETIEHIISSCTVLAQSEYKKRHDILAKIIHMNLAVDIAEYDYLLHNNFKGAR